MLLLITSHPEAIGLDNPQVTSERLLRQLSHQPLTDLQDERLVLPWKTKHDHTRILVRRVGTDIAEPAIKGYENPSLALHQNGKLEILRAADALVVDRGSIMACSAKQVGDLNWEVLVDLESHAASLGHRQDAFTGQLSGIRNRSLNGLVREGRIAL